MQCYGRFEENISGSAAGGCSFREEEGTETHEPACASCEGGERVGAVCGAVCCRHGILQTQA